MSTLAGDLQSRIEAGAVRVAGLVFESIREDTTTRPTGPAGLTEKLTKPLPRASLALGVAVEPKSAPCVWRSGRPHA
jgi:hypothetical protein